MDVAVAAGELAAGMMRRCLVTGEAGAVVVVAFAVRRKEQRCRGMRMATGPGVPAAKATKQPRQSAPSEHSAKRPPSFLLSLDEGR